MEISVSVSFVVTSDLNSQVCINGQTFPTSSLAKVHNQTINRLRIYYFEILFPSLWSALERILGQIDQAKDWSFVIEQYLEFEYLTSSHSTAESRLNSLNFWCFYCIICAPKLSSSSGFSEVEYCARKVGIFDLCGFIGRIWASCISLCVVERNRADLDEKIEGGEYYPCSKRCG